MMGRLVGDRDRLFYAFDLDAVVPGDRWVRRIACATGTAVSQGFRAAHGFETGRVATDVPHRYATRVLAESLGKPSLWVIINAPWYQAPETRSSSLQPPRT